MIFSTILNLFVTPVLYVIIAGIEDRLGFGRGTHTGSGSNGTTGTPTTQPGRVIAPTTP